MLFRCALLFRKVHGFKSCRKRISMLQYGFIGESTNTEEQKGGRHSHFSQESTKFVVFNCAYKTQWVVCIFVKNMFFKSDRFSSWYEESCTKHVNMHTYNMLRCFHLKLSKVNLCFKYSGGARFWKQFAFERTGKSTLSFLEGRNKKIWQPFWNALFYTPV